MTLTATNTREVKLTMILTDGQIFDMASDCIEHLTSTEAKNFMVKILDVFPDLTTTATKKTSKKATVKPATTTTTTDTHTGKVKGTTKSHWGNEERFFANGREAIDNFIARAKQDGHEIDEEIRSKNEYSDSVAIISLAWTRNKGGIQCLIPDNLIPWATSIVDRIKK